LGLFMNIRSCPPLWCHSQLQHTCTFYDSGHSIMRISCYARYFGPKRRKWKKIGENCTVTSFMIWTPHQVLFGW
jgi:hypothetical protein